MKFSSLTHTPSLSFLHITFFTVGIAMSQWEDCLSYKCINYPIDRGHEKNKKYEKLPIFIYK